MTIPITMPALSPTMEEGNLAKWRVRVGEVGRRGRCVMKAFDPAKGGRHA